MIWWYDKGLTYSDWNLILNIFIIIVIIMIVIIAVIVIFIIIEIPSALP